MLHRPASRDPSGAARTFFKHTFGYTPTHLVKAPARLELLGNCAEWNAGLALTVAIDRHLCLACAPRTDGRVELVSAAYPQRDRFWLSEFAPNPEVPWTLLVKAMLRQLRQRGVFFGGFNAAVHSEIPPGAGLGSSGALLAATALAVRELYPFRLTESGAVRLRHERGRLPPTTALERLRLAKLCQQAELEVTGQPGGLLDCMACLCANEFETVLADTQHGVAEALPFVGEISVVVCDTGAFHPNVEAKAAALRAECAAAARVLGVKSLRAAELKQLKAARERLTAREFACAYHVVAENQRVVAAERALRGGDWEQFGQYLFHSHASSEEFFQNSTRELDLLVDLARAQPSCLGARLSGQGFGGFTVNLVAWNDAEEFMTRMTVGYLAATGRKLKTLRCRVAGGAAAALF
ncbi:MAG: galactokinase [Verrucomicrobiota bacterium]